jgi:hypothetical protein
VNEAKYIFVVLQPEPTYAIPELEKTIPIATLDDISLISSIISHEQELYDNYEYHKVLGLITRRVLEISRERRLKKFNE